MREIKFRAWNKRDKYMQDVAELSWRYGGLHVEDAGVHIGNGWVSINQECKEQKGVEPDAILEQFTGLKDKNGKDIYERDIVKNKYGWIMSIAYDASEAPPEWVLEPIKRDPFLELTPTQEWRDIEIIGNIHENPELIK